MHPKALVILPNNLGDVLMTLPVLDGIRKKNKAEIHFFVEKGFEAGLENNCNCDRIIPFERAFVRDNAKNGNWRESVEFLKETVGILKNERYDTIINLAQHPYISSLVTLIQGTTVKGQRLLRAGNHAIPDHWSQYLYAIPYSRVCNHLHATDIYRRIAGVEDTEWTRDFTLSENEKIDSTQILKSKGIYPGEKLIVFQPGAAYAAKRWPVEYFIALGKLLTDEGWKIIISGAPSEQDAAKEIERGTDGKCAGIAGDVSFRQSMAITSMAHMCVTGDTALMHAAALSNVKTLALFGPTSPVETGPYGPEHVVFCGACEERPCFKKECAHKKCMRSISPDIVHAVINDKPLPALSCDIYRTSMRKGIYTIDPVMVAGRPYHDRICSDFTRRLFEPGYVPYFTDNEKAKLIKEIREFTVKLEKLFEILNTFRKTGDVLYVKKFETEKQTLGNLTGVNAFLTAIFNMRQNSIPLLDVSKGILEMVRCCETMKTELTTVLDSL